MKPIKWTMIAAAALLIVLIGCYVRFVPQSFFSDIGEIEIYRVVQNTGEDNAQRLEITESVDPEALSKCLPLLQCRRYRRPFAPYAQNEVEYEIDGIYRGESFHIILGSSGINYIYESAEKGGFQIIRSDSFLTILNLLNSD